MSSQLKVLILGGRTGAIEAAIALGCSVYLIADKKTPKRLISQCVGSVLLSFPSSQGLVREAALQLFPEDAPEAIIPVSEQGVLPAAWCREIWSHAGMPTEEAEAALIKSKMKERFIEQGIPCWPTHAITSVEQACEMASELGYPLVVKALASSGSRGFRVIPNRARLRRVVRGMLEIPAYGGVGVEPYFKADEFSLELLLVNGRIEFHNFTEYVIPCAINLLPATLSAGVQDKALKLGKQITHAFKVTHGLIHIEFYRREEDLWVGEINARPPGGGLMELMSLAYQQDFWQLVIGAFLPKNHRPKLAAADHFVGNWMIHPGAGKVKAITGAQRLLEHPFTLLFRHKAQLGQVICKRLGSGESVGQLIMAATDENELRKALCWAYKTLDFQFEPKSSD